MLKHRRRSHNRTARGAATESTTFSQLTDVRMPSSPLLSRVLALVAAGLALLGVAAPAVAQGQFDRPKYASIVVDANSGEVLYSLRADEPRFPASISKVMTLYLTFEALTTGRLSLQSRVPFSAHAAAQAPSKIGVRAGGEISVDEAIQSAAVMSANDSAVALAERIGGNEQSFAALMTLRAQELGMKRTRFVNANGLPDSRQISTARDLAILSRAVMRDYPQFYHYFNQRSFTWAGRTTLNHNRLLLRMPGMDGLKTGYTNAAGFNLAASAVRGGRRLITVVLGGSSSAARNENVETLINAGFDVLDRRARGQTLTLASMLSEPDDASGPILRAPVEMGSADQAGLQVVLAPPAPMRLARADLPAPAAVRLQPALARGPARTAEVCETVHVGRRHHRTTERRCHAAASAQVASAAAAPDCRRLSGRSLRACRADARAATQVARAAARAPDRAASAPDCSGLRGRSLKACKADAAAAVTAVAASADCTGLRGRKLKTCRAAGPSAASTSVAKAELRDCAKATGRRARAACRADGQAATATAKADGGDYQVQVGAFGSRADAKAHLAKLTRAHAALFGGASEQVQGAGKAYRARFAGLSQSDAKAACKALSAKGERCMVVR